MLLFYSGPQATKVRVLWVVSWSLTALAILATLIVGVQAWVGGPGSAAAARLALPINERLTNTSTRYAKSNDEFRTPRPMPAPFGRRLRSRRAYPCLSLTTRS